MIHATFFTQLLHKAGTLFLLLLLLAACRKEEEILAPSHTDVTEGHTGTIKGFYLLNEGNMGSNKASLDYFDCQTGVYSQNIFPSRNPGVVRELGDVGNDIGAYGNKLYAVINCSHLVEVMNVHTAKHIATITVPNCRYVAFDGAYAYVSSYAGPVLVDPNARLGYVAKIDTLSLRVVDTCVVGYQPEEMVISGHKLYVANSGGYRVPNYDYTVSVIDLRTFTELKKIPVGINLHRMELDRYGNLYVSSRGDYYHTPSRTFIIDTHTDTVTDTLALPNSNMTLCGDSLLVYSTEWSYLTQSNSITYAVWHTKAKRLVSTNFITDGTEQQITIPYGLAVNPETREILVTDAKDYVTPGKLICYSPDGKKKWEITTGDIPAHFAFVSAILHTF